MPIMNFNDVNDLQYQILATRRENYDNMLWQTPIISLTAQAFLFTVVLGGGSTTSRIIASILALIAALASVQLLAKHRYHEVYYAKILESIERSRQIQPIHARPPKAKGVTGWSSYKVWQIVLWLFALAAIGSTILTVFNA